MGDARSQALLVEIEKKLREWLKDGVTIENVTGEIEAEGYEARAAATTDPALKVGYLSLAEQARRGK